jgi:hypothetical protein
MSQDVGKLRCWIAQVPLYYKISNKLSMHAIQYHIMLYRVHLNMNGFEVTMLVVIGTDCTGILVVNPTNIPS